MTSLQSTNPAGVTSILLFIDSLGSGGAQRQLVTLANALAGANYKVYLVCYYPYWHFRDYLDQKKVELIYLPRRSKRDVLFVFRLTRLLYQLRPDVILSYLFTPNVLIRFARLGYFRRCRVITSERNIDLQRSKARLRIERFLSMLSDAVVTNAAATRDMLVQNAVCPEEKIAVIPNGVDTQAYEDISPEQRSAIRQAYGIQPGRFLIVLPGRIQPQKNHISLLRALTLIEDVGSRCEVLFVGDIIDQHYRQQLDRFIETELQDVKIKFAGQSDDMNAVYEIADLVVLPSLFEGLPNIVIEAMFKAKLIAISNTSDNADIINHGVTGFIHDINDDKHLAKIIVQAMEMGEHEAAQIRQAAHEEFNRKYTVDAMLNRYIDILSWNSGK